MKEAIDQLEITPGFDPDHYSKTLAEQFSVLRERLADSCKDEEITLQFLASPGKLGPTLQRFLNAAEREQFIRLLLLIQKSITDLNKPNQEQAQLANALEMMNYDESVF